MTPRFIIRDYHVDDFEAIKALHDATEIDYKFPNIDGALFLVKQVMEVDGVIRMALGAYIQCEYYLWMDKTEWAFPDEKFEMIRALEKRVTEELWLKGVDEAVLYIPPGYERFGDRISDPKKGMGFTKARDGWIHYNKLTETK
jgi:hypothetical protein